MVVHEATAARQAVLRMAASHLWMRGVISASLTRAAHPPPRSALTNTYQA